MNYIIILTLLLTTQVNANTEHKQQVKKLEDYLKAYQLEELSAGGAMFLWNLFELNRDEAFKILKQNPKKPVQFGNQLDDIIKNLSIKVQSIEMSGYKYISNSTGSFFYTINTNAGPYFCKLSFYTIKGQPFLGGVNFTTSFSDAEAMLNKMHQFKAACNYKKN